METPTDVADGKERWGFIAFFFFFKLIINGEMKQKQLNLETELCLAVTKRMPLHFGSLMIHFFSRFLFNQNGEIMAFWWWNWKQTAEKIANRWNPEPKTNRNFGPDWIVQITLFSAATKKNKNNCKWHHSSFSSFSAHCFSILLIVVPSTLNRSSSERHVSSIRSTVSNWFSSRVRNIF